MVPLYEWFIMILYREPLDRRCVRLNMYLVIINIIIIIIIITLCRSGIITWLALTNVLELRRATKPMRLQSRRPRQATSYHWSFVPKDHHHRRPVEQRRRSLEKWRSRSPLAGSWMLCDSPRSRWWACQQGWKIAPKNPGFGVFLKLLKPQMSKLWVFRFLKNFVQFYTDYV